jgi:hypothetical protein
MTRFIGHRGWLGFAVLLFTLTCSGAATSFWTTQTYGPVDLSTSAQPLQAIMGEGFVLEMAFPLTGETPHTSATQPETTVLGAGEQSTTINTKKIAYTLDDEESSATYKQPNPTTTSVFYVDAYTYSAAASCPTQWTATRSLSVEGSMEHKLAVQATRVVTGLTEVQTIAPRSDYDSTATDMYRENYTITYAIESAQIYILPTGLAEPTNWDQHAWEVDPSEPQLSYQPLPDADELAENCQPPYLPPLGPNYVWNKTASAFVLDPALQPPPPDSEAHARRREILGGVLPFAILFSLGLCESFFWFSRLMHGQFALRGGTVIWGLMTMGLGLKLIKMQEKRPRLSRELLGYQELWERLSRPEKLGMWLKWGFRWKYPVELLGEIVEYTPQYTSDLYRERGARGLRPPLPTAARLATRPHVFGIRPAPSRTTLLVPPRPLRDFREDQPSPSSTSSLRSARPIRDLSEEEPLPLYTEYPTEPAPSYDESCS